MAVISGTVIAAAGTAYSISQSIKAAKDKKAADEELKKLNQPNLTNAYENNTVSTLGADLQREESARNTASSVSALAESGGREIIGGVGRVNAAANNANRQIASDLDIQQKAIDENISMDDARLRIIAEQRHNTNVANLSSQYNTANQAQQQGVANAFQGLSSLQGVDFGGFTPQVSSSGAENLTASTPSTNYFNNVPSPRVAPNYTN